VLDFSARYRTAPHHDIPLCLKHFAEVYILEPRRAFREDLAVHRMMELETDAGRWPQWAFGTFS
jgi:hypothetical protein